MPSRTPNRLRVMLACAGLSVLVLAACTEDARTPTGPDLAVTPRAEMDAHRGGLRLRVALARMRRATARYQDLNAALADGFVFLHGCEVRPDEGPAGVLYVHFERLLDGRIDPSKPDALLYEPGGEGRLRLVGAELAIPYTQWTEPEPPEFFGAEFQPEDEFGVWGLHVWIWRRNPEGMFAESNPRVSC
jgi:hypothetical protein